jgi:hypothetical protein
MIALTDFLIRRTFERFLLACSFFPGWMLRTVSEPTLLRFAYIDWGLILRYFDGIRQWDHIGLLIQPVRLVFWIGKKVALFMGGSVDEGNSHRYIRNCGISEVLEWGQSL